VNNLKIGVRLGIGFSVLVALIAFMSLLAAIQFSAIKKGSNYLTQENFPKIHATNEVTEAGQNICRSVSLIVAIDDAAFRAKEQDKINKERSRYRTAMNALEMLEKDENGKAVFLKMKEAFKTSAEANNKAVLLASAGKREDSFQALIEAAPLFDAAIQSADEIMSFQNKSIEKRSQEIQKIYKSALVGLIVACAVAILIAVGSAIIITRGIIIPLGRMREMIKDIAQGEGDLTKRLIVSSTDELGETCQWFNVFIDKLQGIISKVVQTTHQVASASSRLHTTSDQMATGAEQVAAQVSTVATAGEEMSATSGDIAQNCILVAECSQQANAAAVSGAGVVNETIAVMRSIAERVRSSATAVASLGRRSDQIGEIVGTIEDIADQTNLLALNAAIEAARAGEQGRGFAVVADEVRALAERTTRATGEIGEMIKAIQLETRGAVIAMEEGVREVANGSEKAANSGIALEQILKQINLVTNQIDQVATAAEEQTATTTEISTNIQQIAEVTSHTSRGAQESATAANQLSGFADELLNIVGQFRLS
jgi:methyl-accepting chemotaxis protein